MLHNFYKDPMNLRKVFVVLALILMGPAPIAASEVASLDGRWAVDPADCTNNRYVWVFSSDRAGLFVDNGVISGWRRARFQNGESGMVAVTLDGIPRREFRWRWNGPNEIVAAGLLEDGRIVEERSFQVWRRCNG
jgi:hypothetical protein